MAEPVRVIGVDPGEQTGIAIYEGGKLVELLTMKPLEALAWIGLHDPMPSLLVVEDPRGQSYSFRDNPKDTKAVAFTKGRAVGRIDLFCAMVENLGKEHGLSGLLLVTPRQKGKKLDAPAFKRLTGWTGRSNEHNRDAALVAWKYRYGAENKVASAGTSLVS